MKILAGIVLFNPDLKRLEDNLRSISNQVDGIALFNNGESLLNEFESPATVLKDEKGNIGVASALNKLCEYAFNNNFDWVLTLDQDSICPEGLISEYKKYISVPNIGMICPRIVDRNYGNLSYDGSEGDGYEEVDACITSASMISISAWNNIGGFWDDLFIDMVDFDICWALKNAGYKIIRIKSIAILHEIGHSRKVTLFGKENVVFNHPPFRSYYMARNTIAVGRKYHRLKQCIRWAFKRIVLINCFENQKCQKNNSFLKGIIDGFRMKI